MEEVLCKTTTRFRRSRRCFPCSKSCKLAFTFVFPLLIALKICRSLGIAPCFQSIDVGAKSLSVCYFGLNRSLRSTHKSIRKHLLEPFLKKGYRITSFYHTYDLKVLTNNRSKESKIPLNTSGFEILGPFAAKAVDSQEDFLRGINLSKWVVNSFDPWYDNFTSMRNLASQLNSIDKCCKLLSQRRADIIMFARPDMLYFNDIDVATVEKHTQNQETWILPKFEINHHRWNDRFIISTPWGIQSWCHRINSVPAFVAFTGSSVHGEKLVKFAGEKVGINMETVDLKMARVRADGSISAKYDRLWLQKWNLSHWFGHTCYEACEV